MNKSVLHICSGYAQQRLYPQLFAAIHDVGIPQSVYVPVRNLSELKVPGPPRAEINYNVRHILRPFHRLLFRTKVHRVKHDLLKIENPKDFKLTHAHFLYSDGAVALRLFEQSGTPFIAAVRNTDLNVFMRLRPDLKWLMHRIVRSARALVFLSPAYRDQFLDRLPPLLASSISARCVVIPNGLDSEWFNPLIPRSDSPGNTCIRVLYAGDFSRNKNVLRLIEAIDGLQKIQPFSLTLVGGGGEGSAVVDAVYNSGQFPWLTVLDRINNPLRLRNIYREHDVFAMPSFHETFGLVYIEALSQGLPVVYSKGQGIDGYFPSGTIVEAIDPSSADSIACGILAAAYRIDTKREACISAAQGFSWPKVAVKYRELYESVY